MRKYKQRTQYPLIRRSKWKMHTTLLKIPKVRKSRYLDTSTKTQMAQIMLSSMEDPVVPLERNLHGHPLTGLLWERQFEKILLKHGWEKIPNWECLFVNEKKDYSKPFWVKLFHSNSLCFFGSGLGVWFVGFVLLSRSRRLFLLFVAVAIPATVFVLCWCGPCRSCSRKISSQEWLVMVFQTQRRGSWIVGERTSRKSLGECGLD